MNEWMKEERVRVRVRSVWGEEDEAGPTIHSANVSDKNKKDKGI